MVCGTILGLLCVGVILLLQLWVWEVYHGNYRIDRSVVSAECSEHSEIILGGICAACGQLFAAAVSDGRLCAGCHQNRLCQQARRDTAFADRVAEFRSGYGCSAGGHALDHCESQTVVFSVRTALPEESER